MIWLTRLALRTGYRKACRSGWRSSTRSSRRCRRRAGRKKEIDAHIADRFLEAVWREALWLVKDGIATTEEIDEAIRMGFGLRWAQMGLFETYRIAGGEAGMKHFIEQFGPCLQWPWTKLMDVPELTDALVDQIASQSDAQSGHHSIRELERIRDTNLVAMMRALKAQDYGAGAVLNRAEPAAPELGDIAQPLVTVSRRRCCWARARRCTCSTACLRATGSWRRGSIC